MDNYWPSLNGLYDACEIGTPTTEALREVMNVLPLEVIFQLLNDAAEIGSKEQIKKVLKCLDVIFNSDDGFDLISSESTMNLLKIGLEHSYSNVRLRTLLQLQSKFITNSLAESRRKILVENGIIGPMIMLIRDETVSVSQLASRILIQIASENNEESISSALSLLDAVKETTMSANEAPDSIISFRILDTIGRIGGLSKLALDMTVASGFMDILKEMVLGNDYLIQMNALHLVANLGISLEGIEYMKNNGILDKLFSDLVDPFLAETAIKVVAVVASNASKLKSPETKSLCESIFKFLSSSYDDRENYGLVLSNTIPELVSGGLDNFLMLMENKEMVVRWLELLSDSSDDELVTTLHGLAYIFRVMYDIDVQSLSVIATSVSASTTSALDGQLSRSTNTFAKLPSKEETISDKVDKDLVSDSKIPVNVWTSLDPERDALARTKLERLFNAIGVCNGRKSTISILVNFAKKPFQDVRFAAYNVLRSVCRYPWGVVAATNDSGFHKWMLDTIVETSHEGKEWKFTIVESIMRCDKVINIIGDDLYEEYGQYLKSGPSYRHKNMMIPVVTGVSL